MLGHEETYFVKEHSHSKKYSEDGIIKMLEFLVDNIFVVFARKVFQPIVGIPLGTNCAPLLADKFLYPYEAKFIQSFSHRERIGISVQSHLQVHRWFIVHKQPRNQKVCGQMYPAELEIKDTTECIISAPNLDLLPSIGRNGQLHTSIYDKRDDFNFYITNFPFLNSNISSSPAYGYFISQLVRYARACSSYECFILRARGFPVSYSNRDTPRNAWNRYRDSGSFMVDTWILFSNMKSLSHECQMTFWPLTSYSDFPTDQTFDQWHDLDTELDLHCITIGFHRIFAKGMACQHGTVTLPNTWFRPPFWDLLMLQSLILVLPCLFTAFHPEYPSVLSWLCFVITETCLVINFKNVRRVLFWMPLLMLRLNHCLTN